MKQKELYFAPTCEVTDVRLEGVIAASMDQAMPGLNDYDGESF